MPFNAAFVVLATMLAFAPNIVQAQSGAVIAATQTTLEITNKVVAPDGFKRLAVIAGGTLPGPLLTTQKGGRFKVKVVNKLTERAMLKTTSVHWHGLFQKGTNWADGATFINQCPIASGHSFLYDFPTDEHTNTYWYHGHHELQYCDGLRGPMVIYDKNDPHKSRYDVDDAGTVITLMDWYHMYAPTIGPQNHPDSTLINGKGRYAGGPAVALSIVNVEKGKRYRMRLASLACDANYQFSIDGHTGLEVIETDGESTKPVKADSIQIFAGQRYSFVLHANQPIGNYWIRALPNIGPDGFAGGVNSAILRYKGAKNADPTTVQAPNPRPLLESKLAPLDHPAAPGIPQLGAADVNIRLEVGQNAQTGLFTMNGVTYVPPPVPVLLQILSGAQNAQDLLPAGSVYVLPRNKVVELTIVSLEAAAPHPFHLHGHAFSVVKGAQDTQPNFVNPPRRDVYNAGGGSTTTVIRFVTDNAGPWMFHCHIEFHAVYGMSVIFAADTTGTQLENPVPAGWSNLCPIYNALDPADH